MEGLSYFITGAANGIGLEYTKMALRAGGRVVMTDINRDMGEERLVELREQYGSDKVMFAVLNVTDEDQWVKVRLSSLTGICISYMYFHLRFGMRQRPGSGTRLTC